MIRSLVSFSVKHPVSILSIILAIILLGSFCVFNISWDLLPVINCRKLIVCAEYQGISAQDMRELVTIPLEDAFVSLKGLKRISSVTRDGLSTISLELHWGSDCDMALVECREIIDLCYRTLPANCQKPKIQKDIGLQNTITVAMIPVDGDLLYGRHLADKDIKPILQRIKGCGSVSVIGGLKEQISVNCFLEKLEARGLTLQDVANVLNKSNFEYPAGNIKSGNKEFVVKTAGLFTSLEEISSIPVAFADGSFVNLSDIAQVKMDVQEKESFFTYQGKECIQFGIAKKENASPIELSSNVRTELERLTQQYDSHYSFVVLEDLSLQVKSAMISLALAALAGVFVTTIVIFAFLGSWRKALLLSSVIPISALAAFISLKIAGATINIMSLSGMSVGIGMVVDAGAIVLENLGKRCQGQRGKSLKVSIVDGVTEVALSNTSSALTTAVVFIPIFFLQGLLGELFKDMALAIIAAVITACLLSLTYIPAMYSVITFKNYSNKKSIVTLQKKYNILLQHIFEKKYLAFIPIVICIFVALFSVLRLEFNLLPKVSSGQVAFTVDFPAGTELSHIEKVASEIATVLDSKDYIVAMTGGIESNDLVSLSRPEQRKEQLKVTLYPKNKVDLKNIVVEEKLETLKYEIKFVENEDLLSRILAMSKNSFVVTAENQEQVNDKVSELQQKLGTEKITVTPSEYLQELIFEPNRTTVSRFSMNPTYVAASARGILEGVECSPYYNEGKAIPIVVNLLEAKNMTVSEFSNTIIRMQQIQVPLRILGNLEFKTNPKVLYRYNRHDAKLIQSFDVDESQKQHFSKFTDLQKLELQEMIGNGLLLLVTAILLLYLVMGAQFQSFLIPILLLISLPPAFAGGMLFLLIFNQQLNIHGIVALVVLFGTSVNNSILLYESCLLNCKLQNNKENVIKGCTEKLQALFVTNLTTTFALIPFAFGYGGRNSQTSLALCIIGGLIFSTVLVLTVVPFLFTLIPKKRGDGGE
ncbi:MAG: efflux RND transporter permease subunit [Spirochaetaceae bacterium]|nr:efflux RND transporter permease subunit [Spirochaetaceae bacterium]